MNSLSNIKSKATSLNQTLERIENDRQHWAAMLKTKLLGRLGFIKENILPTYWYVTQQSDEANKESIFLVMPTVSSGIVNRQTNAGYIRHGGYLQFAQSLNGQVSVLVCYPYVETITTRKATEILKTLPPSEFSEEVIDGFVETFLDKMDEWFRVDDQKVESIGFRLQRPPIV